MSNGGEQQKEKPHFWKPEAAEILEGTFVQFQKWVYQEQQNFGILLKMESGKPGGGSEIIVRITTVLQAILGADVDGMKAWKSMKPGDKVEITYIGKKNRTKDYLFKVNGKEIKQPAFRATQEQLSGFFD